MEANGSIGELRGELRQISHRLSELERGQRDLRKENAQDHAAVVQTLTGMGESFKKELDKKADQIDLEDVRDEGRGAIEQLRGWLFTLLIAVVGAALVNVLLNTVLGSTH